MARRRPKQTDVLVDAIKRWIVVADLKPGAALPNEAELQRRFAMSKGTVREALKALEVQGLATIRTGPRGGATLTAVSFDRTFQLLANHWFFRAVDLDQVYGLRRLLEPEMAALAAAHLTDEHLARLEANLAAAHDGTLSPAEHGAADLGFHDILADAEKTHPVVIDASGHRPSDHFHPARVVVAAHSLPLATPADAASTLVGAGAMAAVRTFAREQATKFGLALDRVDDFALAVTELATNSVRHGGGESTVRVWTESESIVCQVNDNGHITDVLAGRTPVHANDPGGRGLLLVNRLADLVRTQTTSSGTAIQVRFDLRNKKAT